jgi:putative protein kinase ArgK-like GTPase of G3E family
MDAAGYNPIIIETVGTGQAEVEVMRTAQTVMVVAAPAWAMESMSQGRYSGDRRYFRGQ